MRLSHRLIVLIKGGIKKSFGDVSVILFGSRVDDTRKGGDIDLAINTEIGLEAFKKNKVKFLSYLVRLGYDLDIDIVQYGSITDSLLKNEIEQNGIEL
jgi:uncharacterized protein